MPLLLNQLGSVASEVHVGNDHLRLEDDAIVVDAHALRLQLLDEIGHVVGQTKEVLLVEVVPGFAGHFELVVRPVGLDGALAFDGQHVPLGDAVVEDDPTVDLEHVGGHRQIPGRHRSVAFAGGDQENGYDRSDRQCEFTHSAIPPKL